MPPSFDAATLTTIASTAIFCVGLGWFISQKLNDLSNKFQAALTAHKEECRIKFEDHALRVSRLELKTFGFTHSGKSPDWMDYPLS